MSFFDLPSFVISCEGDTQRRNLAEKRLLEQGIKFEFFTASDGYKLPQSVFEGENIFHREMGAHKGVFGAQGVGLSHKRLWRKIVEENIEWAVIYEDDVTFHPDFKYFANVMWEISPKSPSLIYMGYCCFHLPYEGGNRESKPCVVEGFPMALHAYIIHKDVAKWFLEKWDVMRDNVDIHMQKLYYEKGKEREWKCYVWWNGAFTTPIQHQTKIANIYFNGFCYQDHNMQLSIHRHRNKELGYE